MAFIINESLSDHFPVAQNKPRRIAHGVLGINKVEENGDISINGETIHHHLLQFIRKGGDVIESPNSNLTTNFAAAEKYRQFRSEHKELWGDVGDRKVESCTMFELNPAIEPVLRFQAEHSMVCAFVVSALMIHYRQVIHPETTAAGTTSPRAETLSSIVKSKPENRRVHQTPRKLFQADSTSGWRSPSKLWIGKRQSKSSNLENANESPPVRSPTHRPVTLLAGDNAVETRAGTFTLNIGRYMRNNLTAQEKYETIFLGWGFAFEKVLVGILRMSNDKTPSEDLFDTINIRPDRTPQYFYEEVKRVLKHGPLCIRIKIFDGYSNKSTCVMEPGIRFIPNTFHFVTIHGVALTGDNEHGGIMFAAHDSLEAQPYKNFSLELLRNMRSGRLIYIPFIPEEEIKMPNETVFDLAPEAIVTAGGLQLQKCEESPSLMTGGRSTWFFHLDTEDKDEDHPKDEDEDHPAIEVVSFEGEEGIEVEYSEKCGTKVVEAASR